MREKFFSHERVRDARRDFRARYHVPGPHRDALTRRTNNNVETLRPQRCKASRARNARITLQHYIMMRECNVASAALENGAKKIAQKNAREGARVHAYVCV